MTGRLPPAGVLAGLYNDAGSTTAPLDSATMAR